MLPESIEVENYLQVHFYKIVRDHLLQGYNAEVIVYNELMDGYNAEFSDVLTFFNPL